MDAGKCVHQCVRLPVMLINESQVLSPFVIFLSWCDAFYWHFNPLTMLSVIYDRSDQETWISVVVCTKREPNEEGERPN